MVVECIEGKVCRTSYNCAEAGKCLDKEEMKEGGLRFNEGKPRYDLIPPEILEALAVHYTHGDKKYLPKGGPRNWEKGMSWMSIYRSLFSHLVKWALGKDYDEEDPAMPGYRPHAMVSVMWNAAALYIYHVRKVGSDDRLSSTTGM